MKALSRSFFNRPTLNVAQDLIGCYLVRKTKSTTNRYQITETEAYDGPQDLACHAARGRRTKRTEVLFAEAGTIYIYFTYGMHWLLNIVTGPKEYPAAVLIRGVIDTKSSENISGPAKLTKKLGLDGLIHAKLLGKKVGLWLEKGKKVSPRQIKKTARIGVDYAGPIWSKKKWRFMLDQQ